MQLHKEMGLNFSNDVELSSFGINAMKVVLKSSIVFPKILDDSTTLLKFYSINSYHPKKISTGSPYCPGPLTFEKNLVSSRSPVLPTSSIKESLSYGFTKLGKDAGNLKTSTILTQVHP